MRIVLTQQKTYSYDVIACIGTDYSPSHDLAVAEAEKLVDGGYLEAEETALSRPTEVGYFSS